MCIKEKQEQNLKKIGHPLEIGKKFEHFVGKNLHNLAIKLRFVNFNELGSRKMVI